MAFIHKDLAAGRWHTLRLVEQFGNIGSEVSRALKAKATGNLDRMNRALDRALELFDLTIADPRHRMRLKKICRLREAVQAYFYGDNEFGSTPESLERYFLACARAARRTKRS